ncbi:MAG: hypothetical protein ACRC6E_14470 [Fusobacteriaceae bacterium]
MKTRGFELVFDGFRNNQYTPNLPKRGTKYSAGYDFECPKEVTIEPNGSVEIWTDIKAYMQNDEVLKIYVRSSLGTKYGITLANDTGIIDADYYYNDYTGGNIGLKLVNNGDKVLTIKEGDRIAQGIFVKFLTVDGEDVNELKKRTGGYGSTN